MTVTLKKAFDQAARLPEPEQEALGRFVLDELELLAAIEAGVQAADRGDTLPVEEVRKMIPGWITKSSSHDRR